MTINKLPATTMVVAFAALLSGCVVGQSVSASYEAGPAAAAAGTAVALNVHDERAYVKSGEKPPFFIGQYRGGFGNPWNVSTEGDQPLAGLLQRDIGKELQALGHPVVAPAGADRVLDVAIDDYQFDAYMNGKFWYAFTAKVLDQNGKLLAQSTLQDHQVIEGSFWTGGKGAVEKKMPELYAGAIRKLVRDNPQVIGALAAGAPAP